MPTRPRRRSEGAPGRGPRAIRTLEGPSGAQRWLRAPAPGEPSIVSLLASTVDRWPAWIRIVATTRPEKDVLDELASLRPIVISAEDPRNLRDVEKYAAEKLGGPALRRALQKANVDLGAVVADLAKVASGNFLYAKQALDALESGLLAPHEVGSLPPGLGAQYQQFLGRQFPTKADRQRVEPLLAVLAAAQDAIGIEDLCAATGVDESTVESLLREVSSYLREISGPPPRWAPYHRSRCSGRASPSGRRALP